METSRKKRRFETFHREEKIALINAVRNKSCIWDTKYYYDQNAIRRAWESVGAELGKDANECRSAWQSLKDSFRYHRNKMVKYENAGHSVDWEFEKYMNFLSNVSSQKSNMSDESACQKNQCSDGDARAFMGYFENFVFDDSQKPFLKEKEMERDKKRASSGQSNRSFKRKHLEEKIELINAVKNQNCLWNIKNRKYWDLKETRRAWESVGAKLNRDPCDCRSAWRLLKDSLRYHKKKPKEYAHWALASYMNFLPLPLERRSVVEEDSDESCTHPSKSPSSYSMESLEDPIDDDEDIIDGASTAFQSNKPGEDEQGEINSLPEESCTNNDNKSEISSSSKKNYTLNKPNVKNVEYGDEQDETTSRPEESCENDDNKTEITSSSANNYPSNKPTVKKVAQKEEREKLIVNRYLSVPKPERNIFPFWNELLSKLPPSNATDVEMEVTNLIYAKVKAYELSHNYD